jgi:inorganic pyrophosphatase
VQDVVIDLDKNVQLMLVGTFLTLASAGLIWMVSTLITVDKRTEVMDVKMDHVVQAINALTERQAHLDKSWTNTFSNYQTSRETQ